MIYSDLAVGARAMTHALELSPNSLPELLPWLGLGLVLAQRELLMYLWRQETDG